MVQCRNNAREEGDEKADQNERGKDDQHTCDGDADALIVDHVLETVCERFQ